MYKRIYFLFIVFLLFSLIACNTKKEVTNTKTKTNINIITETEKSETDEKVLIDEIDVNYEQMSAMLAPCEIFVNILEEKIYRTIKYELIKKGIDKEKITWIKRENKWK